MISVHIRKELHSFHGDFSLAADFDSSARHMVLFGASGSGKTLTLQAIAGLINPDSGHISVDGDVLYDSAKRICRPARTRHVGYLLQDYALFPNLNVQQNITYGLRNKPGISSREEVDELIDLLGLREHLGKRIDQLSGGQKQRVAIARALANNPKILLCDEPTGALDYKTSKEILDLIERVNKKYGNTVILVTHNDAIKRMADRVIRLRDGMIRSDEVNREKLDAMQLDW